MTGKILIVDNEKDMLTLLGRIISEGTAYETVREASAFRALELLKERYFDMVITDLKMPKMDGIKLLEQVKKINLDVSVVIMTAYATIETAVEAIQKGAYDYITKPFRRERILLTVEKAMKWQKVVKENKNLRQALAEKTDFSGLLGSTPAIQEISQRIKQVAPTTATVLITGPSGTGKELVAKAIHENRLGSSKKMVTVNCAAIPEQVIESELFGHVKGAFTGAWKDKKGLVEEAHGGTLFLDEIGDLGLQMQMKILRLFQEGEYKPVGSLVTKKTDLRFIAATNQDLKTAIKEKRFREDLYYRLNVIHIELPSLNERKKDIPLLSYHFLKKFALANQKDIRAISPEAMQVILSHDFPGNVRELENIIERAVIFCRTDVLEKRDLYLDNERKPFYSDLDDNLNSLDFKTVKDDMIRKFHREYIQTLLRKSKGNVSRAAEIGGIQRQYLHRLMKETDIDAADFRDNSEGGV